MQIEMSVNCSGKWEDVELPPNCLPFHQCRWFGSYWYNDGKVIVSYRKKERKEG